MKNILIYAVALRSSGGLTILNEYHDYYYKNNCKDYHYYFIVSTPELNCNDCVTVLRYPWIAKSWAYRLYFEVFILPDIIVKNKIDKIFSLQNILIQGIKVPQVLYLHNSLPFVNYHFSFFENRALWFYQNPIGFFIKKSIKNAEKVIVQTKWLKRRIVEQCGVNPDKVEIKIPKLDINDVISYTNALDTRHCFFYPATPHTYKNHKILFAAVKELVDRGYNNFEIVLTIKGSENDLAKGLYTYAVENKLPINFRGVIPRGEVFSMYSKSVLVFPSYIESLGLPLLEAKMSGTPIIAADTIFAREILKGYDNIDYFKYNDSKCLTRCMNKYLQEK